jgi:signal transduction histidine kinase
MLRVASLTNRIFVASTLLATVSLGFAFYFVNAQVSAEAEADLRKGLADAATLVEQRRQGQTQTFATLARVIAETPYLKAAVETRDPPTVQPLAEEFRTLMGADLLVIADDGGRPLAAAGSDASTLTLSDEAPDSPEETFTFVPHPRGVLQVITVPLLVLPEPVHVYGRMSVGFFMDDAMAARVRELTGADVAFAASGRILASSLPPESRPGLHEALGATDISLVKLAGTEYVALARPMVRPGEPGTETSGAPVTLVLRSRTERLRVLNTLRAGLAGALIVTVLLATILSYFVARTMTRPLRAVTSAMRDVSATGDLTRKVPVRSSPWDDEDARLLTTAFNTLTESIAVFQREAAQKQRLSSLGRLSTVIAHEIRNPLMIIRASLSTLRRPHVPGAELREAVADIDEETTRLNRIVTEVLDFARPLRFELAPAQLNDICRASVDAAWAGASRANVQLDLDAAVPAIVTDAERLRTALVNILTNARHAVQAVARTGALTGTDAVAVVSEPAVVVSTRARGARVSVSVHDRGTGIAAEDLAHIFDAYFTTRRAGTGLGLPIAKNIIEGLGGTLAVSSRVGEGTEVRIDLPLSAEASPKRSVPAGASAKGNAPVAS